MFGREKELETYREAKSLSWRSPFLHKKYIKMYAKCISKHSFIKA